MKRILKLGSIALGLALMPLTPLCQAQQWSGEQNLGGYFYGAPFAAQIPGTNVLQVFYQGKDGSLATRWRGTDGSWSNQQDLGDLLHAEGLLSDPIAIGVQEANLLGGPSGNALQVFYQGEDNHLWTLWRLSDGTWDGAYDLGGQLSSGPSAAPIPGTNEIEVFYRGADGSLKTQSGNFSFGWTSETDRGGQLFGPTCTDATNDSCFGNYATPIAIQIPNTNDLVVFYRGQDNHLRGRVLDNAGNWGPEQDFGGQLSSDPSAAPVPGTDQIEVFYRGADGSLKTQWGNLNGWVYDTQMAGWLLGYYCGTGDTYYQACGVYYADYATPKAYVQPGTNNLWVFYRGQDGGIWNSSPAIHVQERTPDGTWQPEFSLGGTPVSDINAAPIPGTNNQLQIFYRDITYPNGESSLPLATQWYPK
jgi:hypothetical protein